MKQKLFTDRFLLLLILITALTLHFLEKELAALVFMLTIFTLNWEGWLCSWRESEALTVILEKYGAWQRVPPPRPAVQKITNPPPIPASFSQTCKTHRD